MASAPTDTSIRVDRYECLRRSMRMTKIECKNCIIILSSAQHHWCIAYLKLLALALAEANGSGRVGTLQLVRCAVATNTIEIEEDELVVVHTLHHSVEATVVEREA